MKTWHYSLPNIKYEGWARIILREDGFFAAVSDYGNYAYLWNHHGCKDFREFFLDVEWQYVASKLKPKKVVNDRKSIEQLKLITLGHRRTGAWNKEKAREAWDWISRFRDWHELLVTNDLEGGPFDAPWDHSVLEYESDVTAFAKEIVCKRLRELLKKELDGT